jgi:hypothetical protein
VRKDLTVLSPAAWNDPNNNYVPCLTWTIDINNTNNVAVINYRQNLSLTWALHLMGMTRGVIYVYSICFLICSILWKSFNFNFKTGTISQNLHQQSSIKYLTPKLQSKLRSVNRDKQSCLFHMRASLSVCTKFLRFQTVNHAKYVGSSWNQISSGSMYRS